MSVNHCERILNCPCGPNPFSNLSAEKPDPASFFSFKFIKANIPLGAPDPWWGTTVAVAGCTSTTSQQDADDCAVRIATHDVLDTETDNGIPIPVFGNAAQSCQVACPTGFQPFVYTVPAGTIIARSQEEADALAASYCLYRAQLNRVCVPVVTPPSFPVNPLAWWKMEEIGAGDRVDVIGGKHLVKVSTNGSSVETNVVGKVNQAVELAATNGGGGPLNQFLRNAPSVPYSGGGMDMTGWFRITNFVNSIFILDLTFAGLETITLIVDPGLAPDVDCFGQFVGPPVDLLVPLYATLTDGNWHFLRLLFDPATLTYGIQVDNGTIYTGAASEATFGLLATFDPVVFTNSGGGLATGTADIDELALWPRHLTNAEVTTLYNAGMGHTWPFT